MAQDRQDRSVFLGEHVWLCWVASGSTMRAIQRIVRNHYRRRRSVRAIFLCSLVSNWFLPIERYLCIYLGPKVVRRRHPGLWRMEGVGV